jgi:hypothetical protein
MDFPRFTTMSYIVDGIAYFCCIRPCADRVHQYVLLDLEEIARNKYEPISPIYSKEVKNLWFQKNIQMGSFTIKDSNGENTIAPFRICGPRILAYSGDDNPPYIYTSSGSPMNWMNNTETLPQLAYNDELVGRNIKRCFLRGRFVSIEEGVIENHETVREMNEYITMETNVRYYTIQYTDGENELICEEDISELLNLSRI